MAKNALNQDSTLLVLADVFFGSPEDLVQSEYLLENLILQSNKKRKVDPEWAAIIGEDLYVGENNVNIHFIEKFSGCLNNLNGDNYPYFQRMARLLGDAFTLLNEQDAWDEELKGLEIGTLQPSFSLNSYFLPRHQVGLELYFLDNEASFNGPEALAFWIWRYGDATKDNCWSTLQQILVTYDKDWCRLHPDYCL
ncbi:MAG: hypothetical protein GC193_07730 [Cryomorphaceae bacterium]|nr:hypothetical protein [Cryomorphaceae bacterium]